jgi:pimeloyl-ACP methyl ester carboxylesterase
MAREISHPTFAGVAGAESHFAPAGANRVHYVTVGKGGRTLVFVHGWACHLGFWREQISALADKARLILIDLPGHGQSDKPETDYTMDFFAEAVLAVLRDAKVDKAILVGHSMGGAVVARVHHHAPEKIAALVSVDGLLLRLSDSPEQDRALIGGFASPHYLACAQSFIRSFFPVPGTEALRDRVLAEMLATPQHVMLGGMRAMLSPGEPDWILQEVNAPVIVINAPTPWWTDAYVNYVRSLSSQSDYHLMDGAGHFLMLEKPAEFNAILVEKLRKFDLIAE